MGAQRKKLDTERVAIIESGRLSVKGETSIQMNEKIILASSSEYKAAALRKLKIDFEQIDPNINEALGADEHPREACQRLALSKARTVA